VSNVFAIEAQGVKKAFGPQRVLAGVDLQVARGSIFALLGPNGAGKTTMVRICSTLAKPDAGTVVVAGCDVVRQADRVRSLISLTGQYAAVDDLLTGEENIVMIARLCRLGGGEARRRAAELLAQFDLAEAARRPVKTYSGGMRRRLDLAVSLVTRPQVIFLDEPTTGLDPRSRQVMWAIIRDLAASGVTIFLTTQYLEEADQLADRIAVLDGGKLVAEGTAEELKRRVAADWIELSFADEASLALAAAALVGTVAQRDAQNLNLSVPADGGTAQLRTLLEQLAQCGVPVQKVALRSPTLDDVFLTLTGHKATQQEAA
jgi:ABC-2 type transport system ATP-binding protein